jgi:hypothetical protein
MQTGAWAAARTKVSLKLGVYGRRCAIRGAGRCYLAAPYPACHTCDLGCSFTTFRGRFSFCLRDHSVNLCLCNRSVEHARPNTDQRGGLLLDPLDFLVRICVDPVERASGRIDYVSDLANASRHRTIRLGPPRNGGGLALAHLVHRVNRLAGVLTDQSFRPLANRGGIVYQRPGFRQKPVSDSRPIIRRSQRPQPAQN